MKIDTLHDLYIHGIQDMRTGCAKTFQGMERMRDAATDDEVRQLVQGGLDAMNGAMAMFDRILERHGAAKDETANKALKSLAEEAIEWTDGQYADDRLRDIAIVEKTRNIAAYPDAGFVAFAHQAAALGYEEDARELGGEAKPDGGQDDQRARMDALDTKLLADAA
jgi:ferritin-like metal-binding protein YciE